MDTISDHLPTLPCQAFLLAGPRHPGGAFYLAATTWRRCAACGHHADIPLDSGACPTCETYGD